MNKHIMSFKPKCASQEPKKAQQLIFAPLILITLLYPALSLANPGAVHLGCAEVSIDPPQVVAPLLSDQSMSVQGSINWLNTGCDVSLIAELRSSSVSPVHTSISLSGSETEVTLELLLSNALWGGEPTLMVWGISGSVTKLLHKQNIKVINVCESKAVAESLGLEAGGPDSIPEVITGIELYTINELESLHRRSLDPAQLNEATTDLHHLRLSYAEVIHDEMYRFNQINVYQGYSLSCLHTCYGGVCDFERPRVVMSFKPIADLHERFTRLPLTSTQLEELSSLKDKATLESERLKTYHTIMLNYEGHNPLNHWDPYELSHTFWVLKSIQALHIYIMSHLQQLQDDDQSQLRRAILKQSSQLYASEVQRILNSDLCDPDVFESLRRPLDVIMNSDLELIDLEGLLREYHAGYELYISCLNRTLELSSF